MTVATMAACAWTDDDAATPVPAPRQIDGVNQLCVYPEPVDTSIRHFHTFEPRNTDLPDTMVAYKGADRWVGSLRIDETVNRTALVGATVWRGEEPLEGTWDVMGFVLAADMAPGCYPLSSSDNAWMQDSVEVFLVSDDYDIRLATYLLDPSAENYFELLSPLDNGAVKLRARFRMTFLVKDDEVYPPFIFPKVRFTNGYLEVKG